MNFPNSFYFATFAAALITTLVSLPLWRKFCLRAGLIDDPGHRKIHKTPVVLAGGLAVFTGLVFPLAAGVIVSHFNFLPEQTSEALNYGFSKRALQLAGITLGALGMLLLGLLDDKYELKAGIKFAGQLLVAVMVAACDVRITIFVPSVLFSYLITVFWIVTVINAFNFMDNMNGLCGGLGTIAAFQFGLIASGNGQYLVAMLAFLIAGSLLGFIPYNFPKASSFLGDSGSHLVGYLLAVTAILPHFYTPENPRIFAVLSPLFILAMPLSDMASVVLLRWRMGKPFYIGDNNHLSHRLTRAGCSKAQAVIVIWIAAVIIGSIALL